MTSQINNYRQLLEDMQLAGADVGGHWRDDDLLAYCYGALTDDRRDQLLLHLSECANCAEALAELRAEVKCQQAPPRRVLLDAMSQKFRARLNSIEANSNLPLINLLLWTEETRKNKEQMEKVKQIVQAIFLMYSQQQRIVQKAAVSQEAKRRGTKRSVGKVQIKAEIHDQQDKPLFSSSGDLRIANFTLEKAEIRSQGGLFIDLSSTDKEFCIPDYSLVITLSVDSYNLCFPAVDIAHSPDPENKPARAFLRAKLGVDFTVWSIPVNAIHVVVRKNILPEGDNQ